MSGRVRHAAITGWAWRTPLGADVDSVVARLLSGERAARPCFQPSVEGRPTRLGATLAEQPTRNPHRRFCAPLGIHAMGAAREAMSHARLEGGERVGAFAAVGGLHVCWPETLPGFVDQQDGADAFERGLRRLHPFWLLQHLSNNAHALFTAEAGTKGEGATFGGANASAQAIVAALRALEEDALDTAVVMAYDSLVEPEALVELAARGCLTRASLEDLHSPYEPEADGFVPGECAAAIVIESAASAGSRALCLIDAAEGADGSEGEPQAGTLARVLAPLAHEAAIADGAGRARPTLDAEEREVLGSLLARDAALTCVSSALGQCGGAASLVQAIALSACLRLGKIPPIAGLAHAAQGPLRAVAKAEETRARCAVAVSGGAPGLAGAVRVELP